MHRFEKFFINSKLFNFLYRKTVYAYFFNFINSELEGKALEIGCGIGKTTSWLAKNSAFDYAIETGVFHHIKEYKKAVKETSRVLKKNGYFYMMDVSQYFFMLWPIKLFFPPEALLTKKEFIEQLENNGFKIEKSKGRLLFFIAAKKV